MKMLCLWLVNHLFALTIFVYILGGWALGTVLGPNTSLDVVSTKTFGTIMIVAVIVGLILAILTARFAKANYYEMLSSGFMRWTSSISLWQSEWKFFFKTLLFGLLFYGEIVFFVGLIVCAWLGQK